MNWALRVLGLGSDADERAIKRAYATRLKTTRPEDDPEGFQRLHEAYQAALSWMQSRSLDADPDEDIDADAEDAPPGAVTLTLSQDALFELLDPPSGEASGRPHSVADPAPGAAADRQDDVPAATFADGMLHDGMPRDEVARFDPEAFLDDCIALAVRSRDGELLEWLNAQPALWSLAHKARVAPWLLHRLHEQRPPIEARRFDALAEFFGLLDLHSGYDAYTIHRLRHRLQLTWEIETRQIRALAERSGQDGGSMAANLRQSGRILGQLARPLHWPQALWAGLVPGYPGAVRRFMLRLDFGNLDDLPTPIRGDQIAFWNAAGDRSRFSAPRWAVSVARLVAYALILVLGFKLFFAITSSGNAFDPMSVVEDIGNIFIVMLIGWLGYLAYEVFMRWQALPESAPARIPWFRSGMIPALCVVVVAIDHWLGVEDFGAALAFIVFLLALQRYRLRSGLAFDGNPGSRTRRILIAFIGLAALCIVFASGFIMLGIVVMTLALWAVDMRKQRAALQN